MEGKTVVRVDLRRPDLRVPIPADLATRLEGARIVRLDRRAKYLLAETDRGDVVLMHLGMSGRFTVLRPNGLPTRAGRFYHSNAAAAGTGPHDHVVITLQDGTRIVYADPRRFGLFDLAHAEEMERHRLLTGLGIEPLDHALTPEYLAQRLKSRRAPLKVVLLDQRLIAGLGNIYACEILYRARLSPRRAAGTLAPSGQATMRLGRLVAATRAVITEAIDAGGSSLRDYAGTDGELGYFQHRFDVYDRAGEPCRSIGCGGTVRRLVQSGRSTFFCSRCQR